MRSARIAVVIVMVIVGSGVLAVAARAGGGCTPPESRIAQERVQPGASGTVVIANCSFDVPILYVDRGTKVSWTNKDPFQHTVTGLGYSWGSSEALEQSDVITQQFRRDGVFPYFCSFHPGMVGVVIVGDPNPNEVSAHVSADGIGVPNGPDNGGAASTAASATSLSTLQMLGLVGALVAFAAVVTGMVVRRTSKANDSPI